ncbi:MAG: hypothetical protein AB8H80_19470, partial [Planctomycetota bacterium]
MNTWRPAALLLTLLELGLGLGTVAGALLPATAAAQGPVYRERWAYLHLENRRRQVWEELAGRPQADYDTVAKLLAEDDKGIPFVPVAKALAHLRGCTYDAAYRTRAMVSTFVLPEVVDRDATVATCRNANFSIMLPYTAPVPGEMSFAIEVRNAAGDSVYSHIVERKTSLGEVRLGQAQASMSCLDMPSGRYEVEIRTLLDGEAPSATDPVVRWTFHVLHGYQARADAALALAQTLRDGLDPITRAIVDGCGSRVSRAYTGEAFAVASDAVADLERFEACLDNLSQERPVLAGMTGDIALALPVDDAVVQPCIVRRAAGEGPHPAVVFAAGAPCYDFGSRRPTSPQTREGDWLLAKLAAVASAGQPGGEERGGFDFGGGKWHLVSCDSPGGGRKYAQTLLAALQALPKVLALGAGKPLLVCDREAAAVVALHLQRFRRHVAGVVLVG